MPKTYGKASCGICGKPISFHGLAMVSHLKTHVKTGELDVDRGRIAFTMGYSSVYNRADSEYDNYRPCTAYF
jgi:hypothetical protein